MPHLKRPDCVFQGGFRLASEAVRLEAADAGVGVFQQAPNHWSKHHLRKAGVALKVQIHRPLPEDSLAEGHIAKRLT